MTTATAQLADSQHPWIGLASFTEGDREFFAGRGEEIDELLRLVRRDILTLLYGVSGLGKTSLLQAGLFPPLRAEDCLPVPIRLDYLDGAAPLTAQVLSAIIAAADAARVEVPQPRPDEALWEYLHREGNHFWSPRNDLVTPFLAFDQFEELFTLGRETPECAARTTAFISELADLVENRPPAVLRDDPLRAKEFSFKPAQLKVLLAMREDYLADLDRIRSHFRALGQNRLRLLPMGERQARHVIALGAPLLAPGVEDRILEFVAGGDDATAEVTIAPALLSLVLRELNERRLARGMDAKITSDLLDVEQQKIFENFYLRTIQDFPVGVRTFIEDKLLTTTGFRGSCAVDDALSCPDVTQPILNELVNRRLLTYEDRHRTRRVELTHDVLTGIVRSSRDSRRSREEKEEADRQRQFAEDQRRQAEERELRTNLQKELAQRTAIQARKKILEYNSTIVTLADKLIENAAPEEAALFHEIKAMALSPLGRHNDAIDELTVALNINPNLIAARLQRGFEYINIGDSKKSLDDYESALRINARGPLAFLHKGQLLGFQGHYEEAARAIKSGIEELEFTYGEYHETALSPDLETATAQTVLFADPKEFFHALYLELANLKAYAGELDFAAALKAADDRKATSNGGALFALLWAWQHIQHRTEDYGALAAQGALWECAHFKDWAKEYYTRFERTHAEKRAARYSELAKWVDKRLEELHDSSFPKQGPTKSSLLVLKAQELNQQGNQDSLPKIRELLDKAVDQEPENIGLLIARADFFLGHKQYHEAIKDYDAIVTKSPRSAVAYLYRAIANINLSESGADIEADLREAIKCDPHYSDALIWLSARMESPDPNEALKLLYQSVTEGIRGFANIPYVYSRIAALQSNLGRYKEAAEATRIAIAMKSDVLDYYEQLAVAERGLGKSLKNAAHEVARFCQTQAEARSALGQKWNAFNTYWTGFQFLAAAKSQSSDAVDVQPEIVSMVSGVSKVLESIGSKEQAIVFWNSATNWFKANDEALKEEVFLGTIASKEQAIVFWNSVIKSGQFKAYGQVFKDEINRLSATRGSAAPVQ